MRRLLTLLAALVAGAAIAAVPRAGAVTGYYSWSYLATPGQAAAINDAGMVVGTTGGDAGTFGATFAFAWTSAGGLRFLTGYADSPAAATAVSDTGMVVGYHYPAGQYAFLWTPTSGLVDLGYGNARAVSDNGLVVGDDFMHPVVWTPTGEATDLFAGSPDLGTATDVNARGQVVGIGHADMTSSYVFTWTRETGLARIVDIGTYYGVPAVVKVNDDGIVAGTYTVPPYNTAHGFVWSAQTGLTDLGALVLSGLTAVADLNSAGAVVGYTFAGPTVPPAQHAFLWTRERGLVDLGTLGGKRSFATAIGDDGTVVGYSQTTGSVVYHAFVWTPSTGMLDLGFPGEESEALAVGSSGKVVGYTGASAMGGPTGHAMLWEPRDVVPPTLVVPPDLTVEATSPAGALATFSVSATDNADPAPVTSCLPASGSTFPLGDTTVRCTARDATGNIANGSFVVHVRDTTPPDLTLPPTFALDATTARGAVVLYVAEATDAVDRSPSLTCIPPSGATFPIGETTVTCAAADASGNTATGSFLVHIRGAAEQLDRLRTAVNALGLPHGLETSLLAKLDARALDAFVREVEAQTDKAIASADAADLVARAQQLQAVLG